MSELPDGRYARSDWRLWATGAVMLLVVGTALGLGLGFITWPEVVAVAAPAIGFSLFFLLFKLCFSKG